MFKKVFYTEQEGAQKALGNHYFGELDSEIAQKINLQDEATKTSLRSQARNVDRTRL